MDALKNLEVWQKACRFSADVYELLASCPDRGYSDQLRRSALSIASNIAEGYERESQKERAHFLKIAKGSCAEAWTQILIGVEAGLLPREAALMRASDAARIRNTLYGFLRHVEGAAE